MISQRCCLACKVWPTEENNLCKINGGGGTAWKPEKWEQQVEKLSCMVRNYCSNCSTYRYRDFIYRSIHMRKCHSKWQFKPYVPTFSMRLCTQNQAVSAQMNQKFKNKLLSLKSVRPSTGDLDTMYPGHHEHRMKDDYRACFVVKLMMTWFR